MAPIFGIDVYQIKQTGWGVVFPYNLPDDVRRALDPLLELRRGQAGHRYGELTYQHGESKLGFLARYGVGPGFVDPSRMPYYLLLVGGPDNIPFEFQYDLRVQFAVGRLFFDSPSEYAIYAESVVHSESGAHAARPNDVALIGVSNCDDLNTQQSRRKLIEPLLGNIKHKERRRIRGLLGNDASKENILKFIGGEETPSLLLLASHGVGFDAGDRRQFDQQGSLLCQDWPGPKKWRSHPLRDMYIASEDICSSSDVRGIIAILLPVTVEVHQDLIATRQMINGKRSRRAILWPSCQQRLLGHPRGSALAVVGTLIDHSTICLTGRMPIGTFEYSRI